MIPNLETATIVLTAQAECFEAEEREDYCLVRLFGSFGGIARDDGDFVAGRESLERGRGGESEFRHNNAGLCLQS